MLEKLFLGDSITDLIIDILQAILIEPQKGTGRGQTVRMQNHGRKLCGVQISQQAMMKIVVLWRAVDSCQTMFVTRVSVTYVRSLPKVRLLSSCS